MSSAERAVLSAWRWGHITRSQAERKIGVERFARIVGVSDE